MSEIEDYLDHVIQYYRERTGMFTFHMVSTILTGTVWLWLWGGWLIGSMIRGDWKEDKI